MADAIVQPISAVRVGAVTIERDPVVTAVTPTFEAVAVGVPCEVSAGAGAGTAAAQA